MGRPVGEHASLKTAMQQIGRIVRPHQHLHRQLDTISVTACSLARLSNSMQNPDKRKHAAVTRELAATWQRGRLLIDAGLNPSKLGKGEYANDFRITDGG